MAYAYNGKILHVDLSNKEVTVETPDERFYRTYMGGGCLGAYYLLKETKAGVDPLGPDNVIIFAPSIMTGAPIPGLSRHAVITKSPLTGAFLDSQAGGYWGPELKFAGYDAIVVKGKAAKPVYLWINDGKVEIKDAGHFWGKVTGDAQEAIRRELNEPKARMLLIGPGGENMVRYACVLNECNHANGRGGGGAVMGSKNLKAVVCRGTNKPRLKDTDKVREHASWFAENFMDNPSDRALHEFGTSSLITEQLELGELPSYNFKAGNIENGEALSGTTMAETIRIKTEGCFACPVRCKMVVKAEEPYEVDPYYGGPEYETLAAFGSSCGITDLVAVAKANELCNKNSLDTISTGLSIAFAMECYENGILTKEDTDGMELKFGDAATMVKLVEMIARREGKIGALLAEGSKRAAEKIGKGAEKYAIQVKGMEMPLHDPRDKASVGMGYACSPLGADHVVVEHDSDFDEYAPELYLEQAKPLGMIKRLNKSDVSAEKVRSFAYCRATSASWTVYACVCFVLLP